MDNNVSAFGIHEANSLIGNYSLSSVALKREEDTVLAS